MTLWIVGKWSGNPGEEERPIWEFQGVFDSEERALTACRNWRYFLAPAEVNQELPDEFCEWVGTRYPITRMQE
jgi:hypothetical protein